VQDCVKEAAVDQLLAVGIVLNRSSVLGEPRYCAQDLSETNEGAQEQC
jgi:hypothetical protein